ncbi:MAG: tyrosine-type recombinase/integrase, partial [Verrucomicrobiota bacterium]|nr:tyrosine-type recombinase/integrase [Verrucomicrobiota bacterium]
MKRANRDRLSELFFHFLEFERHAAPRTLAIYRHALAQFRETPGLPGWKDLTPDHFRRYLFDRSKRGVARATIRLHFAALRTFYRFLTERHGLKVNPLKQVQLPKPEKKLPLVLTARQVAELLDAPLRVEKEPQAPVWMPARDAAILELFYSSGLRLAELVGLDVRDIDFFTEGVRVLGKGRKERVVPVGKPALNAIQRYRAEANVHTGPLFISKLRRRITPFNVWLALQRYLPHTSIP